MSYLPEEPVIVMTASEARILWSVASLGDVRNRNRSNAVVSELTSRIHALAVSHIKPGAARGGGTGADDKEFWSVPEIARSVGLSERSVRLDCEQRVLEAEKRGRMWLVTTPAAKEYIRIRRRR